MYKNSQWKVTDYGIERNDQESDRYFDYDIPKNRLLEPLFGMNEEAYSWPMHMSEKNWVDVGAFCDAFRAAMEHHHGIPAGDDMVERSVKLAARSWRS